MCLGRYILGGMIYTGVANLVVLTILGYMYPGAHTHTRVCTRVYIRILEYVPGYSYSYSSMYPGAPRVYTVYPTKRTLGFEEPSPHLRGRANVTRQDHNRAGPDIRAFGKQESDAAL